jgi:hypothetical protein
MKNRSVHSQSPQSQKGAQHHTGSRCAWQEAFEETQDLLYSPPPQKGSHPERSRCRICDIILVLRPKK